MSKGDKREQGQDNITKERATGWVSESLSEKGRNNEGEAAFERKHRRDKKMKEKIKEEKQGRETRTN